MLSKIFNASTEVMFWLSSLHLTALIVRTSLSRAGIEFSSGVNYITYYAVHWIFKALSRHKSVGCKRRYGKYRLFYTVQACKFVTAIFCYRFKQSKDYTPNSHVGTRITVLIQTSVYYTRSFTQLTKPPFLLVWAFVVTYLILSCLFLCSRGAPNMANH